MTSKILSVSNINSSFVSDDNAEITTTFNPPLNINVDTQFNFKSGFIDVVGLGNSGQDEFTINTTITANITVSYYEQLMQINTDPTDGPYLLGAVDNTKTPSEPVKMDGNQDSGLQFQNIHYVLCVFKLKEGLTQALPFFNTLNSYESIEILKNNITFNIDPGTYSSDSIVEVINIKLQGINVGLKFYDILGLDNNEDAGINSYIPYERLVKQHTKYIQNATHPNGVYTQYLGFVPLVSTDNEIKYEPGPLKLTYYYKQEFQEANPRVFNIAKVLIGTSLFSLQNIDDLLSFEYTHNPLFGGNPREQIIELQELIKVATGDPIIQWRVRRGGLNLISLEPTSFWSDILGFDGSILLNITQQSQLTPSPIGGLPSKTTLDIISITGLNSFDKSTTVPFIGTADYDSNFDGTTLTDYPETGTATKTFQSIAVNTTISLNAIRSINYSDLNNGGHFLLSIELGQNINNFKSSDTTTNIISIMSREYLNDGFISVFDGGNPLVLSSNTVISYIRVKIIDPITGLNALNLGKRNTFYFELG